MSERTANRTDELTRGSMLARNTALNLVGYGAPLVVAIFAIPLLIEGLGTDRFGVLALAWVLIGYLSLFDLGLGRALTKLVAEKLGTGQEEEIPALIWTALFVMFFLGLGVTIAAALLLPWFVFDVLKIPSTLEADTLKAFYLLAFFLPIVIVGVGLRGVLEAHQRFDLANAVRIPLGIYVFLAPLFVLPFSQNLFPVVGILVAGRLIACLVQLLLCFHLVPSLRGGILLQRAMVGPLVRFGSWMTVSNIVSPLMVYLDRFFISALVSVVAVAYYATPHEVVTKLLLISGSLIGVLFPAFSTSFVQDRMRAALLFGRGVKYTFIVLFPIVLVIVTLADDGLRLWLGDEFAQNSTPVLQWIAVGVFVHSLGSVPFALIQGVGRPDLTGKLHLIELPFYLIGLWWLIGTSGIVGAAIVWTARVTVETAVMFGMAQRLLETGAEATWQKVMIVGLALIAFAFAAALSSLSSRVLFFALVFVAYALFSWFVILAPDERTLMLSQHIKNFRPGE